MLNKQWNFYLNFGSASGGKMTFDEIYRIILSGRTVKRFLHRDGLRSIWYFKLIDGCVKSKLPHISDWENYYFEKDDFTADNWEELTDYEKNILTDYYLEI